MGESDATFDVGAALAETLGLLTLRPSRAREDAWIGEAPDLFGD